MKITAIVMASGMSKRMTSDKLHLKLNNRSIYAYVLDAIKQHNFHDVIVVAKDDDILARAESLGFLGVQNTTYQIGQSESIKYGLKKAENCDGLMFFVADQPFIKVQTIQALCEQFNQNKEGIILPYYNGTRGNPVIFPYALKNQLMSLEGDQGGKVVINQNKDKIIRVDITTEYESMDIDTIEDYEKLESIFAAISK